MLPHKPLEVVWIYIGLDIHKRTVSVTEMDNEGNVNEQYDMGNSASSWEGFRARYAVADTEIALEVSTTGKYVARKLRDMGFHTHMADPSTLALIFRTAKKNDREDSYKLAKLLRLGELPEVHLPSRYSDDLRSLVRYRRSLGEAITMIKNRVHAILASAGISIDATDIFGKKGMKCILGSVDSISTAQRFVLADLLDQIAYLMGKETMVEDEISRSVMNDRNVNLLMTIPGMGIYSSAAIMSEIDDISRFDSKEKLASYAGLVPRQDQSGNRDIKGHISKHGPSMLRFIMVNAAHIVIKYSERMRKKYLSLVRRLGKNRAIVAIARILLETIYTMLKKGEHFVDQIDTLTERKIASMRSRAVKPSQTITLEDRMNVLRNVQKERLKRNGNEGKINKANAMT
ncbi:MAG: IS110 family transposase [Cuniculiplasma divulgatum]|nr:MAG: IS110 family transposase [Cuniculiplasma divulgatum]WMT45513.1 MAG: IS110 family transposase [Cuniculiplasma divulgatum]